MKYIEKATLFKIKCYKLRFTEVQELLFRKLGSMDLHLSSIQTGKFSPLKIKQYADLKIVLLFMVGSRCTSLGSGEKREEGEGA